jgi:hypothetical protein
MHLLGLEILNQILDRFAMERTIVPVASCIDPWAFGGCKECHDGWKLNRYLRISRHMATPVTEIDQMK